MARELPADKYKPLENADQSELYDFEKGGDFEERSQQYALDAMERTCDAEESLEEIQGLSPDLEEERQEALSHIRSLKQQMTGGDDKDDWAI
jgi:hypothetical protein